MKLRTFGFLSGSAFSAMRRHGAMSLASATTMAVSLLVLGLFFLVSANMNHMASFIENQVEVKAYLEEGTTAEDRETLKQRIDEVDSVAEVTVVTKEEALERLKEQFGEENYLLEAVEDMNPLRDSFEIKVTGPENVQHVAKAVADMRAIARVDHKQELMDNLAKVVKSIRVGAAGLLVLLGTATIILISNSVRLTVIARRREVAIMKLVGATDGFIRWPFFLEGMLLGLIGAAIAIGVVWYGYDRFVEVVVGSAPFVPIMPRQPLLGNIALVLAVVGAGVGAIGSCLPLRQFLKV